MSVIAVIMSPHDASWVMSSKKLPECLGWNEVVYFQFSHIRAIITSKVPLNKSIYAYIIFKKTVLSEINRTLICTGEQINVYN